MFKPGFRYVLGLSLLCLALVLPAHLHAQAVNATVVGTVTDSSGAVVGGANVVSKEISTGVSRTTTTNTSGNYVFSNLPPGNYEVSVEAQGFKKSTRGQTAVEVNSTVRVDFALEPGAVSQTVE